MLQVLRVLRVREALEPWNRGTSETLLAEILTRLQKEILDFASRTTEFRELIARGLLVERPYRAFERTAADVQSHDPEALAFRTVGGFHQAKLRFCRLLSGRPTVLLRVLLGVLRHHTPS